MSFLLAHLALLSCAALAYLTFKKARRSQMQTAFQALVAVMLVWDLGTLLEVYYRAIYGVSNMLFINICYLGICFMPLAILFLGAAISRSYVAVGPVHAVLLVIPCVTMIVILTNPYHSLFFVNFSVYSAEAVYGPYYYFHSVYSYGCILVGIAYLVSFTVKSSGIFSMQSLLIFLGILFPLVANILFSFDLVRLNFSVSASSFTVAALCFAVAFYKYDFLKVVPIAVHRIVDLISDGYLVIDNSYNIVGYNKAMLRILPDLDAAPGEMKIGEFFSRYCEPGTHGEFLDLHRRSVERARTVRTEYHHARAAGEWYFDVEITPVFQGRALMGSVILLKDVTQAKRDLETIKETQAVMIERERLASLGQMVGGIAHNLKTPILSISGGIEALRDLVAEYDEAIGDPAVNGGDHHEIAGEMRDWLDKVSSHCAYISDMITTVKGQAVRLNSSRGDHFTVDEFLKRVDLLMKHALRRYHCTLRTDVRVNVSSRIAGDINGLVQIFDNLIINAIHAYEGREGFIDLAILEKGDKFLLTLRDYGKGIPPEIKAKLFREMVTTKGKKGTGLGLYLSYSTIKGHFNGTMEVSSEPGQGAAFAIAIPVCKPVPTPEIEFAPARDAQAFPINSSGG